MNIPEFPIKAKDRLAIDTIEFYRDQCAAYGLTDQVAEVEKALEEFRAFRRENVDIMQFPDHKHVPCVQ